MTFNFDGSACEHATCAGAPEMFIKVEEDDLYYFGVEADDTGSLTIAGEQAIKKDGTPPNGKLNIETDSRYLKAGYYKVALSWTNNAYTPVSNNAIAFNVTMDTKPITEGKYEGNSTMKREFSSSPKIKLWTIEKESTITCEPSKEVELEFEKPEPVYLEGNGDCNVSSLRPKICVTVCKDESENVWRCRVVSVSAGAKLTMYEGIYVNPYVDPPLNEEEATEAVNEMNGYQSRAEVGTWHTPQASLAHEEHHRRQWEDAYKFYWKDSKIQEMLEKQTISCDKEPNMDEAVKFMQALANEMALDLWKETSDYVLALPDDANDRPYCAGQEVLNEATAYVIRLADAFLRTPQKDRWGVLLPKEHPLAQKSTVTPNDLLGVPLLLSSRESVRNELAGWFGDTYDKIEVAATFNLILNAANMVKNGVGAALCYDFGNLSDALEFVPLSPKLETGTVLAWKKDQTCSPAADQFLDFLKNAI